MCIRDSSKGCNGQNWKLERLNLEIRKVKIDNRKYPYWKIEKITLVKIYWKLEIKKVPNW